jgi:hypothetical protein
MQRTGEMKRMLMNSNRRTDEALRLAQNGFFSDPPPGLADRIMNAVQCDAVAYARKAEPAGEAVPMRSWVVIGVFIVAAFSVSLFGFDFHKVADIFGSAFLMPLGLTCGLVVSIYGALFIASHIDELDDVLNGLLSGGEETPQKQGNRFTAH